jgi:hypothetical protein
VPPNQRPAVTRKGTVAVRLHSAAEFQVPAPATAKVMLYTAPPRSANKKAVALGSGHVVLSATGDVTVVAHLTKKGLAAIRHRRELRITITASATGADGS